VIKVVTPRLAFVAASSLGEEVVEVAEVAVVAIGKAGYSREPCSQRLFGCLHERSFLIE
jgi:hypothetical protein